MDLALFGVYNRIVVQVAKKGITLLLFPASTSCEAPTDVGVVLECRLKATQTVYILRLDTPINILNRIRYDEVTF